MGVFRHFCLGAPDVIARKVDVLPTEWREVGEQVIRHVLDLAQGGIRVRPRLSPSASSPAIKTRLSAATSPVRRWVKHSGNRVQRATSVNRSVMRIRGSLACPHGMMSCATIKPRWIDTTVTVAALAAGPTSPSFRWVAGASWQR